jgi:very-short-patch-repair endonuclease
MANHKLTKEKAIELIKQQIIKFKSLGKDIEFLGFKDNKFVGREHTIISLKCIKHNVIFERKLNCFLGSSSIECPECHIQRCKSGINNKYGGGTESEVLFKISQKLEELNNTGKFDLEFLGIKDNKISTNSQKTKIILKCNKHDYIGESTLYNFLRNGYHCPKCIGELNKDNILITNKELYKTLSEKYPTFDFSNILSDQELGSDHSRKISVICPVHGIFSVTLGTLLRNRYSSLICPGCIDQKKTEEAIEKIRQSLLIKKDRWGLDYEFLGFYENKFIGYHTRLILKCNIHNTVWDTNEFGLFVSNKTIGGCPECNLIMNKSENQCYKIINDLNIIPDLIRQHKIKVFDDQLNKNRVLKLDFYSDTLKIGIEFDGKYHYNFVERFHKNKEGYLDRLRKDELKNKYCEENGIKLLRITYKEKKRDIGNVVRTFVDTGEDISIKLTPEPFPEDI